MNRAIKKHYIKIGKLGQKGFMANTTPEQRKKNAQKAGRASVIKKSKEKEAMIDRIMKKAKKHEWEMKVKKLTNRDEK